MGPPGRLEAQRLRGRSPSRGPSFPLSEARGAAVGTGVLPLGSAPQRSTSTTSPPVKQEWREGGEDRHQRTYTLS
eukprot:2363437-Alexandrium_andersonii.AAC.1